MSNIRGNTMEGVPWHRWSRDEPPCKGAGSPPVGIKSPKQFLHPLFKCFFLTHCLPCTLGRHLHFIARLPPKESGKHFQFTASWYLTIQFIRRKLSHESHKGDCLKLTAFVFLQHTTAICPSRGPEGHICFTHAMKRRYGEDCRDLKPYKSCKVSGLRLFTEAAEMAANGAINTRSDQGWAWFNNVCLLFTCECQPWRLALVSLYAFGPYAALVNPDTTCITLPMLPSYQLSVMYSRVSNDEMARG